MEKEKYIKIAVKVLDILAKNECSIAETSVILNLVREKIKDLQYSAMLPQMNFLEEFEQGFNHAVPPNLQPFDKR